MASGPDLRPRSVGELLDGSFFLYRRYFGRFLIVATVVSLPTLIVAGVTAEQSTQVLREAMAASFENARHPETDLLKVIANQPAMDPDFQMMSFLANVLQSLSRGAATATMAVATAYAVSRKAMPSAREIILKALPRIPAAVFAYFFQSMFAVLVVCCMPLGIMVLVLLTPIPALIMFERGPVEREVRAFLPAGPIGLPLKAISLPVAQLIDGTLRSLTLSWHARTVARGTLYVFFVFLFVGFFVQAVSGGIAALVGSGSIWFWVNHYAEVIFLPIVGISVTLWYIDLRIRREGADLLDSEITLA